MELRNGSEAAAITSRTLDGSTGSYALRELIKDIPLSTDENGVQAHITCVDAWNGNLYIGTSSGEVLHYVAIPPDPAAGDEDGQPGYIFATNIEPPYTSQQEGADAGVKQILLLPSIDKACILCNGTLTFYTLPELSPAFGGRIKQTSCLWVGGLDRNTLVDQHVSKEEEVIVICLWQRLRLISFGRGTPQKIRDIELGGIAAIERRGDRACVANGETYSLLDVVNQRQNVLSPISSLADIRPLPELPTVAPTPSHSRQTSRTFPSASPSASSSRQPRSHERNISVGGTPQNSREPRAESGSPWPTRASSRQISSPPQPASRTTSPTKDTDGTTNPTSPEEEPSPKPVKTIEPLLPHIVSPTAREFFLTTGTTMDDPGLGMFVNLDGDVVRGTIEFSSYPESLVLQSFAGASSANDVPGIAPQEGYVLAVVRKTVNGTAVKRIEIQRWDVDSGESYRTKEWIPLSSRSDRSEEPDNHRRVGLRNATSAVDITVNDISTSLRLRRLRIPDSSGEVNTLETTRNQEEDKFASRFSQVQASVLLFEEGRISWVLRNPLILQLDQQLNSAVQKNEDGKISIDIASVQRVINSIRGQEARDELEFLTLTYIRQKASLLLFGNLLLQASDNITAPEQERRRAEEALIDGELDPRPILTLVPPLHEEIAEGAQGIWLHQGLRETISLLRSVLDHKQLTGENPGVYGTNVLLVIKRYLLAWRKKKGFGSVADEAQVFHTTDAALLHALLLLDASSPRGPAEPGSLRAELNSVIDGDVVCFDRATELFEKFQRFYLLSRLYQKRKRVGLVLSTWRRIIEGAPDAGGELGDGEHAVRKYLTKISDPALVQEYGAWLAARNPKLGVEVFADDAARVRFNPPEAVAVLRERAPAAVKDYLEHLVFAKNHVQYVNDLIAFYLDTVLSELEASAESRALLVTSYETYRALHAPKPTYRQFIADNAVDADWWRNRLRLLQLIGGSHGAASKYDVRTLGRRLAPYSAQLVPEMIILHARQGEHEPALKSLVHGLGDFDTAVRYCLLGGENIFYLRSGAAAGNEVERLPSRAEQATLFGFLLREYFNIEDEEQRLERAAELLERFGGWFDVAAVLDMIPDEWAVGSVAGFLTHALRSLVGERHETEVVRALCSAQNLRHTFEFVGLCEKAGPVVVRSEEQVEVG